MKKILIALLVMCASTLLMASTFSTPTYAKLGANHYGGYPTHLKLKNCL